MLRVFGAALTLSCLIAGASAIAEETHETLSPDAASAEGVTTVTTETYSPYQTTVHQFDSQITFGHYNVYVALPRGYDSSGEDYPVVLLQDGDYSFPLAQSMVLHMSDRDGLPPVIVVGIAYQGGIEDLPVYRLNRTRDFTPTNSSDGGYGPEYQHVSGGADKYALFIKEELRPFLEQNYRTKRLDWTYVGHSYGGLFGSYMLLNDPQMFQRYLLVSPSLWYDGEIMLREAVKKAPALRQTYVSVFLAVGSDENPRMEANLKTFAAVLRDSAEGGVTVDTKVFEDENHDTVFPAALARGLRVLFQRADQPGPQEPAAQ
jgi:uncharacterized protein